MEKEDETGGQNSIHVVRERNLYRGFKSEASFGLDRRGFRLMGGLSICGDFTMRVLFVGAGDSLTAKCAVRRLTAHFARYKGSIGR